MWTERASFRFVHNLHVMYRDIKMTSFICIQVFEKGRHDYHDLFLNQDYAVHKTEEATKPESWHAYHHRSAGLTRI